VAAGDLTGSVVRRDSAYRRGHAYPPSGSVGMAGAPGSGAP
jgi:hypothetical protein